jgi:chaperone required for assembly of F1-ATPase
VKRFWDEATIEPAADGFAVLLDGKPLRLPGGGLLCVRGEPLARGVAAEWQAAGGAKGGEMSFTDTPLTRLVGTARDRIAPDPGPTIEALSAYGESDLLCYRVEAPEVLARRQAREWQPWLDWAALTFDASLTVTSGVAHVRQSESSLRALRAAVSRLDPVMLAGLGVVVPLLGSLVLGLAMTEDRLDAGTAHALGALEELFQVEFWGEDSEATARRRGIAADIAVAARLMALARAAAE